MDILKTCLLAGVMATAGVLVAETGGVSCSVSMAVRAIPAACWYSTGDLVRAVRRLAEKDEFMAVHVPGDPASARGDAKLAAALRALTDEARRLNVTVTADGTTKGVE